MKIPTAQLINPGIYEYSDKRKKQQERLKKAIQKADFLTEEEKKDWTVLGYMLSTPQLAEMEQTILKKELHLLKIKHQLEKLKNKEA